MAARFETKLRPMIDLQNHDGVYVLRLNEGENRFNPSFIEAVNGALDRVEQAEDAHALVSVGEGKFYSNGLDLEWMSSAGAGPTPVLIDQVETLYRRMLTLPLISVAALNGHGFAAGAMLALSHDFRVMRKDRGYFCLPEVDIRIPFTKMMSALIQARLSPAVAHESMVTGRRYSAEEALAAQIVDQTADEADVLPQAVALARKYGGKPRPTLGEIKRVAYQRVLDAK
jgi:enoyl-CoA hydratase/carnithine racemase